MADVQGSIKQLRYQVMLALYLPILLYSFSTFDVDESTVAVKEVRGVLVGEETIILGQEFRANAYLTAVQIGAAKGKEGKAGGLTVRASEGAGLTVEDGNILAMPTGGLLGDDEDEKVIEYSAVLEYPNIEGGIESQTVSKTLSRAPPRGRSAERGDGGPLPPDPQQHPDQRAGPRRHASPYAGWQRQPSRTAAKSRSALRARR